MALGQKDQAKFKKETIKLTKDGSFTLPSEVLKKLGLSDASELNIGICGNDVEILPNIHSLAKLYIEPTAQCNLTCKTCIRNTWNEKMGEMKIEVFDKLIEQLKKFNHLQTVMFGGFGEPTYHKDILYMIQKVKALGVRVEMTTNGTLLDENMLKGLFDCKLDTLWVSFDGTDNEKFEEVRRGASFVSVMDRLQMLKRLNWSSQHKIELGITFVAMKTNINELSRLHRFISKVDARKVSISNVLPYEPEMTEQMLCSNAVTENLIYGSSWEAEVSIPKFDMNDSTKDALHSLLRFNKNIKRMGHKKIYDQDRSCRFINDRSTFIRWDGKVSPCMGLIHSYNTYIQRYERRIEAYLLGNIEDLELIDIWNSEEYTLFRERVYQFDFSPCQMCGGCDNVESNKEDCFGNKEPVCGACLWAHGVIQCP